MGKLKLLSVFFSTVMLANCVAAWRGAQIPLHEVGPVTLVLLALTHLTLRAPYTPLAWWEWPLLALSVVLATTGALLFRPEGEAWDTGFQGFLALFTGLAVSYGFFCTAIPSDCELRRQVIDPTRKLAGISLPFLDFGLVFAPFVFPFLLARFYWRNRSKRIG